MASTRCARTALAGNSLNAGRAICLLFYEIYLANMQFSSFVRMTELISNPTACAEPAFSAHPYAWPILQFIFEI